MDIELRNEEREIDDPERSNLMNRNLILVLIVLLITGGIRITFSVENADVIAAYGTKFAMTCIGRGTSNDTPNSEPSVQRT
jgi:hypothetical protein